MKTALLWLFGIECAVLASGQSVFAQWRGYEPGMMGWSYGIGWFWSVLWFALWFGIMVLVFLLIRYLGLLVKFKQGRDQPVESALEILKKRYARGEIKREEFEEKKGDLGA
ncbi:MAG: SHOCT domain-containing protein [Dissulfurispiraceae bacterium]